MARPHVILAFALAATLVLAACPGKHSGNRLVNGGVNDGPAPAAPPANPHTDNPADPGTPGKPVTPAPAQPIDTSSPTTPAPDPTLPRYESYQFDALVIADGSYYGNVQPGTAVSGTFTLDFQAQKTATNGSADIYPALSTIQGTVGAYTFRGGPDYVYVQDASDLPYFIDTARVVLDTATINFDFYFFFPDGATPLPNRDLANLRNLDQKSYRRIVLWFETDPRTGQGFNADVYAIHAAGPPPETVARR